MTRLLIRTTAASGLFYRLGRAWTAAGVAVDEDDLSPEDRAVLEAEPMLHVGPAPDAARVAVAADDDLRGRVRAAIAGLAEEGFTEGAPTLEAVRAALPDVKRGLTAKLVAEVWDSVRSPSPPLPT